MMFLVNFYTFTIFFDQHGISFRFSCPRTSQQNGKSERMIQTINNIICTLLFQAHLPPTFWVEALHMDTHLLNITPSSSINNVISFTKLYHKAPPILSSLCFWLRMLSHIPTPHKLASRSTPCIFPCYPSNHHGFRCFDLFT